MEYVARGAPGAVFFRHAITAIYIHGLLLTSTKASPPPRSVALLWSNQGRVLTDVRFRTDTRRSSPESIEQANKPTEELQNRTKGTETPSDRRGFVLSWIGCMWNPI